MRLGVPGERAEETRVAVIPASLPRLRKLGFEVVVERGAGEKAGHSDAAYAEKGARLADAAEVLACELVVGVSVPAYSSLREGQVLACIADPFRNPEQTRAIIEKGITLLSLEVIPRRLSKGQAMDVNSSQDSLSGYRSVLIAAEHLPKMIPMMTTAAGTIRPARFVIQGAAVAGLQAIATARRLGGVIHAIDVRLAAKTDTESLGARFIDVPGWKDAENASGHATLFTDKDLQEAFDTALEAAVRDADVLITTARIFGRQAPRLFFSAERNERLISMMHTGAVIVDMNTDTGGNTVHSIKGEIIVKEGVTVIGIPSLCRTIPTTASMLYSNNILNVTRILVTEGALHLDEAEQILTGDEGGIKAGFGGILLAKGGAVHANHTRLQKALYGDEP